VQFFTIQAGQGVSLITSAILQMATILSLIETTGAALILSLASLVGFLPYAVLVGKHFLGFSNLVLAAAAAFLALVARSEAVPAWHEASETLH
jgi:DHA3 family macrolide efflux protein-like MFS transporter